jgi:CHAD domain-containing protein
VRFAGAEIELALDQGEVRGAKRVSQISEVELELKSGGAAALFQLARVLSRAAPIFLSFATKSQRGQALVADCPLHVHRRARPELSEQATVAEVFQFVARRSLAAIAGNSELLRQHADPQALHQLRVGVRTLRSALSTFREAVEDKAFDGVKVELRWLAKACDEARNLDVFSEQLLAPALKAEPSDSGLAALAQAIQAARDHAAADVEQVVASARFRDLLIEVTGWLETGDWLANPSVRGPARPFAKRVLQARRRKLLKDGRELKRLDDVRRHKVRIDAKALRYAAEGFHGLFGRRATSRFVKALKAVQDELGALNDLVTAAALLTGLGLSAEAAFAGGELVGRGLAGKSRRIARAAKALDRLSETEAFWR